MLTYFTILSLILFCYVSADGFINGLAAVTHDCLELSSSDVYILAVVYEPKSGRRKGKNSKKEHPSTTNIAARLLQTKDASTSQTDPVVYAEAWKGGERAFKLKRLRAAFNNKDTDGSGYLDDEEIAAALAQSGVIASVVRMCVCDNQLHILWMKLTFIICIRL
jgi:hypothetical protein